MEKSKAINKLKELGIETQNFFDKRTFIYKDAVCVGIFPVEANREEAFYFSINGEDIIYMARKEAIEGSYLDTHLGQKKYQVPLSSCVEIWADAGVFEELPDTAFNKITARDFYAMIQNKPVSNIDWLNALIRKNQ